jgi:uncharacterized protein (TIGR02300 family)
MSTTADIKAQRGTKRMCQNPECGSRFYDLNRDPITCPVCSTIYEIRIQPVSVAMRSVTSAWRWRERGSIADAISCGSS